MSKPLNLTNPPRSLGQTYADPYPVIAKRFTDAELAAEHWKEFVSRSTLRSPNWLRAGTLHRFATTPHYDQGER